MTRVFAIPLGDYAVAEKSIGEADSKEKAAKMIRKHLAEETGDGATGITAQHITFSSLHNAYFIAD